MLNDERLRHYNARNGEDNSSRMPLITPAMYRRMKHKQMGRRTHEHHQGQACPWCKPGWQPARLRRQEQQA